MTNPIIDCYSRIVTGHMLNSIKKIGMVPAVIVQAHKDSINIQVPVNLINNLAKTLTKNQDVELHLDGKIIQVQVKDIDFHPVKGIVRHVDFLIPTKK
jgi:ribosomal protein L25 (general stress protein Ctc)